MRRVYWIGILFLSISWLYIIPLFEKPNYMIGILALIIGIIFNTLAIYNNKSFRLDGKYLILLFPLIVSIFILPLPHSLGLIILANALLFYIICNYIFKYEKGNRIFLGIYFSGIILTIQSFFFPIYYIITSHYHRIDFLSPIVSTFVKVFGVDSTVQNGIVFVQTVHNTLPFTTTLEKLGFFTFFNFLIGAVLIIAFIKNNKKKIIYLVLIILIGCLYLVARYVFLILVFIQNNEISIFWNRSITLLSFIPFALLLIRFLPLKCLKFNMNVYNNFKIDGRRILSIFLIFIFIFSLVGAFSFNDPGVKKNGRILIDEYHSDWEKTTKPMNTTWYGMLSTYNYYSWAEWLNKHYEVRKNINDTLKLDLLEGCDILVLKCPTNIYSQQEIEDIIKFVEKGGGLYLIGDHTNVFGMNYYLNQISKNFGIIYKMDATYELTKTNPFTYYRPPPTLSHPVVQNMDEFHFLTSCTLKAPLTSENIMICNRLLSEPGSYSTIHFFRERTQCPPDVEFGVFLTAVAVKHGKGRVLAFTDSTCFSNFCIFMDGYTEFNLGAIEYLNRENNVSYLNHFFMVISISTLIISLYLLRKKNKNMILFLFLLAGIISYTVAVPIFSCVNYNNYKLPSPKVNFINVCFEKEHSSSIIKPSATVQSNLKGNNNESRKLFGTFFVWTQRVGCFPSVEKTIEDALNIGDIVVIINPEKSFKNEELNSIVSFVDKGGKILLMDSILNQNSTANDLLNCFNLSLKVANSTSYLNRLNHKNGVNGMPNGFNKSTKLSTEPPSVNITTIPYLSIIGENETFMNFKNGISLSVKTVGNGKIVVLVDSFVFSDVSMGGTFTEPNSDLKKIYETEYFIFEQLLMENRSV